MSHMDAILRLMTEKKASDVYLSPRCPVMMKINGNTVPVSEALPPDGPRILLSQVVSQDRLDELDRTHELNMGLIRDGLGNFRISAMRQRGAVAVVIRMFSFSIPKLSDLNVPHILEDLVMAKRGLMLMAGATGSGKSTTLAAMIDHRNERQSGHILTFEDPIEFLYKHKKSVVNQREIGADTASLAEGLRNALRQAPDVIMIGEIRDRETMSAAMAYAQSGHLCLATMHASNSYHALNRILSFYPVEVRPTMLGDLAASLNAVVSQRLLRSSRTGGQLPAVEVLINSRMVADLIQKADFPGIRDIMEKSMAQGSQTFEQDIARMIQNGLIEREEGLLNADSPTNLMWRLENTRDRSEHHAEESSDNKFVQKPTGPSFEAFSLKIDP